MTDPIWYCVWCGATSLDPCKHSESYRWQWKGGLQAVITGGPNDGRLLRDVIAAERAALDRHTQEPA